MELLSVNVVNKRFISSFTLEMVVETSRKEEGDCLTGS